MSHLVPRGLVKREAEVEVLFRGFVVVAVVGYYAHLELAEALAGVVVELFVDGLRLLVTRDRVGGVARAILDAGQVYGRRRGGGVVLRPGEALERLLVFGLRLA